MLALEGRPPRAISRSSPSSSTNPLRKPRWKDGALVTALTNEVVIDAPAYAV
jgi:hypothetical protein